LLDIFTQKFIDRIKESFAKGKPIDWQEIIKTRYLDWAITTPLMLMVLINVIAHHNRRSPSIRVYFLIILLNDKTWDTEGNLQSRIFCIILVHFLHFL
jgi:hypothetical protein